MSDAARVEPDERHDLLARLAPGGAENFITEAFCWLLDRTGFGGFFLERLTDQGCTVRLTGDGSRWRTQETASDGSAKRPDMVGGSADGSRGLIFEHKVNAKLDNGQLAAYRKFGESEFGIGNFAIILITKSKSQWGQCPDCALLWQQVCEWLSTWLDDGGPRDTIDEFATRSFLHLLETRGLGPMPPITPEELQDIPVQLSVQRQARSRVDSLVKRIRSLTDDAAESVVWREMVGGSEGTLPSGKNWGRCGLYLRGRESGDSWDPGIFVGVMHDGYDHGPPSVNANPGDGPVACVILSVGIKRFSRGYRQHETYLALERAVRDRHWDSGWTVYHGGRNSWHPITIYKPLAEVIDGQETAGEQVDAFVADVSLVAKEVLGLPELEAFRGHLAADADPA